jgi:NAD+-dependent protein deacetylase SIR2
MYERGKLLRCYTQNIDGIESFEGLTIGGGKAGQVCQLHGDIHTLRCDYCNGIQEYTMEWMEMLLEGEAPDCPVCLAKCTLSKLVDVDRQACTENRAENDLSRLEL